MALMKASTDSTRRAMEAEGQAPRPFSKACSAAPNARMLAAESIRGILPRQVRCGPSELSIIEGEYTGMVGPSQGTNFPFRTVNET